MHSSWIRLIQSQENSCTELEIKRKSSWSCWRYVQSPRLFGSAWNVRECDTQQLAVSHCAVVAQGGGLERQLVAYFVRDNEDQGERTMPAVSETGFCPNAR